MWLQDGKIISSVRISCLELDFPPAGWSSLKYVLRKDGCMVERIDDVNISLGVEVKDRGAVKKI